MLSLLGDWLGPLIVVAGSFVVGVIWRQSHDRKVADRARAERDAQARAEVDTIRDIQAKVPRPSQDELARKLDQGRF